MPAIFSFTALAAVSFALGGAVSSHVFLACLVSYGTVCGFGLLQDFIIRMGHGTPSPLPDQDYSRQTVPPEAIGNPFLHQAYEYSEIMNVRQSRSAVEESASASVVDQSLPREEGEEVKLETPESVQDDGV